MTVHPSDDPFVSNNANTGEREIVYSHGVGCGGRDRRRTGLGTAAVILAGDPRRAPTDQKPGTRSSCGRQSLHGIVHQSSIWRARRGDAPYRTADIASMLAEGGSVLSTRDGRVAGGLVAAPQLPERSSDFWCCCVASMYSVVWDSICCSAAVVCTYFVI